MQCALDTKYFHAGSVDLIAQKLGLLILGSKIYAMTNANISWPEVTSLSMTNRNLSSGGENQYLIWCLSDA